MIFQGRYAVAVAACILTAGCSRSLTPPSVAVGGQAYQAIPDGTNLDQGTIQPGDRLSIRVMGETELTSDQIWVDGSGKVQLPLAGEIVAGGRLPNEVRKEITDKLAERYLRNPQVAISIVEHAKFSVTVEGEVQKAGRFEASPGLTLLGALALAESTTKDARLDEVVVFRTANGQKLAARFDLRDVRTGRAPDPQIIPGDVVVVGRSWVKGTWHDILQAAPLFNLFYVFRN